MTSYDSNITVRSDTLHDHWKMFLYLGIVQSILGILGILGIGAPGAYSLTMVLTAFFVLEGVFQIVVAFNYRDLMPGSWVSLLFGGIFDLLMAAVIAWAWPTSPNWALGLAGVNLITKGFAITTGALAARKV